MRSFLRFATGSGLQCGLSLGGLEARSVLPGEQVIPLTDGVRDFRIGTRLPPAEIELLLKSANEAVAATAPVVVFAAATEAADAVQMAGLEWPQATAVLLASDAATASELVDRVRAELRWAGVERLPRAFAQSALRPWLELPPPPGNGVIVHVGGDWVDGADLVLEAWRSRLADQGCRLRLVLPGVEDARIAALQSELAAVNGYSEIIRGDLQPMHLADAAAVLLPWRLMRSAPVLVQSLASGRAVCVSRYRDTADLIDRPGICCGIGGRSRSGDDGKSRFEPQIDSVVAALQQALGPERQHIGARARRHVRERLLRGAPSATPAMPRTLGDSRPRVILEAPFFETSSSSELSIETARALARRGNVDLQLVPRVPFQSGIDVFRQRAPELAPHIVRQPGRADLWLSSGWPVRASRPDCETFAVRVDWEYGALPIELAPQVTDEADLVVVHSEHVSAAVSGAGRSQARIRVVPHGVDEAIHESVAPDPEIMSWKNGRPVVLFCGGMVWRKGFDAFLRTVLAARAAGAEFVVVVKSIGGASHYKGFDLRELIARFEATPGTPPLRLIEDELSREQLASLYTASDVLLHPYRGEGFCLPVLEARAAGLPVLATAGGATEALMAGPGARRIASLRRDLELPGAHLGQPWVLDPCAETAAKLLIDTLQDLPTHRNAALGFAASVREAFSWSSAAESIERMAVEGVAGSDLVPRPEPAVPVPGPEPRPAAPVELMP